MRPRHFFTPFLLGTFATTTPPSSGPSASPREYAGATSTRASTSPRMPPSTTTISTMTYKRPLPTAPPLASAASRDAPAAPPPPPRASSYRGPGGFVHTPATLISSTPADAWDFRGELLNACAFARGGASAAAAAAANVDSPFPLPRGHLWLDKTGLPGRRVVVVKQGCPPLRRFVASPRGCLRRPPGLLEPDWLD